LERSSVRRLPVKGGLRQKRSGPRVIGEVVKGIVDGIGIEQFRDDNEYAQGGADTGKYGKAVDHLASQPL
jgi:hypothetical protein